MLSAADRSFAGFCLFRRYETYSNSFSSFSQSLYTCLHSVMSRPTVLYRLQPLYFENNFSALYFVLLTLFGDITFIALIIAVGTRNFRDFSAKNFKARLNYRKVAADALFKLYATSTARDGEATVSLGQFVALGAALRALDVLCSNHATLTAFVLNRVSQERRWDPRPRRIRPSAQGSSSAPKTCCARAS